MTRDEIFDFVLGLEKGLVYDPNDPGGLTNYGIALRFHPELNAQDIRRMTPAGAKEIYQRGYWDPAHCAQLPWPLSLMVFDASIAHGVQTAIILLQRALAVKDDGHVGPVTLAALARVDVTALAIEFNARRSVYYASLKWAADILGWFRRLSRVYAAAVSTSGTVIATRG